MSDIDTEAADGLKVLDPKRPIREATNGTYRTLFDHLAGARRFWAQRNVFAKASQADVPEAANSSGFKTTISNPPHTEAV